VAWKSAVASLDHALQYISICAPARCFVERYAGTVIDQLIQQLPDNMGHLETSCVLASLSKGCSLVAADLNIQLHRNSSSFTNHDAGASTTTAVVGECYLLDSILAHIFSRNKVFYVGSKAINSITCRQQPSKRQRLSQSTSGGRPEVRIQNIEKFRSCNGFRLLHSYLLALIPSSTGAGNATAVLNHNNVFPSLETIYHILMALHDTLPIYPNSPAANSTATVGAAVSTTSTDALSMQIKLQQQQESDALNISKAILLYFQQLSNYELQHIPIELLSMTLQALQKIFDRLAGTERSACLEFYAFWRSFIVSMIASPSLSRKFTGWEQVNEIIKAVIEHRPPPRTFIVSDAGCAFVNGTYHFTGNVTHDGYAKLGANASYVRILPHDVPDMGGKTLTLFRCTMLTNQQKWWFLSEADEEQPGTDRDIDYYQHKSKEHEEAYPPPGGWITCQSAGVNPPPTLQGVGLMVPNGQELETLEHELAKWAIENEIVKEAICGAANQNPTVMAQSIVLIQFLASHLAYSASPGVRIRNIEKFRSCNGFQVLHSYFLKLSPTCLAAGNAASTWNHNNMSPSLETVHQILMALHDTLPVHPNSTRTCAAATAAISTDMQIKMQQQQEMDALNISKAILLYFQQLSNYELHQIPMESLFMTLQALQKIFDRLAGTHRNACMEFYAFWRSLILSMITSPSLPLKLAGWKQVNEIIDAAMEHRPPPRSFIVSDAGCAFVNGTYHFTGNVTHDGYAKLGANASYVRIIPQDVPDVGGKTLTLFRCTMLTNQQKWWFVSETDEEQPGTDRDIDYYQHKSKEHEEAYPPPGGWITCRTAGMNPPPMLQPIGLMVPNGQEMETLEHQLAKWAMEHEIVKQAFEATIQNPEVIAQSTALLKFLASHLSYFVTITSAF
jgi:hypothetical protein